MFHVFLVCSGLAAGVNLLTGYVLYGLVGLNSSAGYVFSVSFAFVCGMGVSFVLNRTFTYAPSGRGVRSELPDFLLVSMGGLLLTTGIAHLLFSQSGGFLTVVTAGTVAQETAAHMIAVGVTAIYSFFGHKRVSFRKKRAIAAEQMALSGGHMNPSQN